MQTPSFRYAQPTDLHLGTAGQLADWLEWRENALPEAVHHVAC